MEAEVSVWWSFPCFPWWFYGVSSFCVPPRAPNQPPLKTLNLESHHQNIPPPQNTKTHLHPLFFNSRTSFPAKKTRRHIMSASPPPFAPAIIEKNKETTQETTVLPRTPVVFPRCFPETTSQTKPLLARSTGRFWTKPHFIAVDEPTNYLDVETVEALSKALNNFRGGASWVGMGWVLVGFQSVVVACCWGKCGVGLGVVSFFWWSDLVSDSEGQ